MTQNNAQVISDGTLYFEGGKDYRPVAMRLKQMLSDHPNWRVINNLVYFNPTRVVFRTDIFDETGRLLATGHAEEVYGSSQFNMFSALPCAETSSCGRALAVLGYIPSRKDLEVILIDGEEYTPVMARIAEFRNTNPDWTLTSQILYHDDWRYTLKAEVREKNGSVISSGHEEGFRSTDTNDINCYHLLETVETSAYGRALAFRGYHGNSLASAEEVINARLRQNQKQQVLQQPVQQPAQQPVQLVSQGQYQQPFSQAAEQPAPQPPVTQPQEQPPATIEAPDQTIDNQAQTIANELIANGFKDESPNKETVRTALPDHNYLVLQDLVVNKNIVGKQIVAHCLPTNASNAILHGLSFKSLTDRPEFWLLNFPY